MIAQIIQPTNYPLNPSKSLAITNYFDLLHYKPANDDDNTALQKQSNLFDFFCLVLKH